MSDHHCHALGCTPQDRLLEMRARDPVTRALRPDEKKVYDHLVRTGGCTRYYLELRLTMTVAEIANALRRLSRHGYAKTGWPERSKTLWLPAIPSQRHS
jgi:hypothetical protein